MINRISEKYKKWNYLRKSKKTQTFCFQGFCIKILPDVFNPEVTRTTLLLSDYLLKYNWEGKRVLELGAGSGLVSFLLANQKAIVTASDISENAIQGLIENRKELKCDIEILQSDLFEQLNGTYDVIILNPPFYQKDPSNIAEKAWYCGSHFEFFESLFTQFKNRPYSEEMWMILSERARVDKIKKMVIEHYLEIYDLVELSLPEEPHLLLKIKSK